MNVLRKFGNFFIPRKRRAALLIEMSIAILLIMIMLLGIAVAYTATLSTLLEVRDREEATYRAFLVLNELESVDFDELDDYIENSLDLREDRYAIEVETTFGPGDRSADITVTVARADGENVVTLQRELSPSASRNAGMN